MTINVNTKDKSNHTYKIDIEQNCILKIPTYLKSLKNFSKFMLITDSTVYKLYGETLLSKTIDKDIDIIVHIIEPGEKNKSRESKEKIEDDLIEHGFGRDSCIVALGGGVIGDLAGFVASTYMRGIPFIQIPTTLLSMVDSSVGGKTAISTKDAKNIIGTFHQPFRVFIDANCLKTLPKKEIISGLVESIKMGVIKDEELFDFIDNNINKILNIDLEITEKIIIKSVENKIEIVVKDEKEEGLRQILNYGHTIGHAIEILKEGLLSHGHCVAIGMKLASDIAVNQGIMNLDDQSRQNELLEKLNINLDLPNDLQIDEIIEKILLDKKNTANNVNFVLIKKIGQIHLNNGKHTSLITKEHIIKVLKNKL